MKLYKCLPVLILLIFCGACHRSQSAPSEIAGTWRTDSPRYEGKFLQFDQDFVIVGLGDETLPKVEHIERIAVRRQGPIVTYVIESRDQEGTHYKITVQYSPLNGGELRLSNPRQVVWKRAS